MLKIKNIEKSARRWELKLKHWVVQTPFFMPIATVWSVKLMEAEEVWNLWAEIILSNTYHLHLKPWEKLIKELWWLHKFMNWDWPILTDSWGFQVFSLWKLRKIKEEWVEFRNHISWEKSFLSPEKAMEIQHDLWVDIAMVLDECAPYPCEKNYALNSLEMTTRWAERCINHHKKIWSDKFQKLFAIIQGSTYPDLRKLSVKQLTQFDFWGFAIWGLAVWEPSEEMYQMLDTVVPLLPENKPRYLMWVWTPENILEAVERGVDMFDCVLPTRNARHWKIFTSKWTMNIKAAKYKKDIIPLDENCNCPVCKNHSRAYLRHLFNAKEMVWMRLATIHNIHFYLNLMKNIRKSIEENNFHNFKKDFLEKYNEWK